MSNRNRFTINDSTDWTVRADGSSAGVSTPWDITPVHPDIPIGTGFVAETPEVAGYGTVDGYDEVAIARWADAPYKKWAKDTDHNIGIIAFHMNGIDRVEISANGGTWVTCTGLVNNPRTGNREYWGKIRFDDNTVTDSEGFVELRARIYPHKAGIPLVLQSPLWGDDNYDKMTNREGLQSMFMRPEESTIVKYVALSGDDTTGDGTRGNPYETTQGAVDAVKNSDSGAALLANGLRIVFTEAGRYEGFVVTDAWRHNAMQPIELEADSGLSWDEYVDGVGVELVPPGSTADPEDRLLWRPYYPKIFCRGLRFPVNKYTQFSTEIARDDTTPHRDGSMWLFENCKWEDDLQNYVPGDWLRTNQSYIVAPPDVEDGGGIFVDSCLYYGMRYGACGLDLVRNTRQEYITHDSVARTMFSVDCVCDKNQLIDDENDTRYHVGNVPAGQEYDSNSQYNRSLWHCDHFQMSGWKANNIIHFGFQATNDRDVQDILIGKTESNHSNQAYVNCIFENLAGAIIVVSQHASWARHILFENLTILDQDTVFRPDFDYPMPLQDVGVHVKWRKVPDWITADYIQGTNEWLSLPFRTVKDDGTGSPMDFGADHYWGDDTIADFSVGDTVISSQSFLAKNFIIRNCVLEQIRSEKPYVVPGGVDTSTYPLTVTDFRDEELPPGVTMINTHDCDTGSGTSEPAFTQSNMSYGPIDLVYTPDAGAVGNFPGTWSFNGASVSEIQGTGAYRADIHRGNYTPDRGYMPKDTD